MIRNNDLERLGKQILNCRRCPQIEFCTPGHGIINAKLMVIGQSLHGWNQDTPIQIPFIGPIKSTDSGILLYDSLKKAGYSFEQKNLFVTNVVHGHPPKNRPSTKEEVENCSSYLKIELDLVRPKIILTLGTDAREWFKLPRQNNGEYVSYLGKRLIDTPHYPDPFIMDYHFIVSVHPSYIKRWGSKQNEETYIKQLVKILKQVNLSL